MELSMWTICDYLEKQGLECTVLVIDGASRITSIRLLDVPDPSLDCLTILPANRINQSCVYDTALVNGYDQVFISGADVGTVYNHVAKAFESYNTWERGLLSCMAVRVSLQQLLEIAHAVFQRPMFIKNNGSQVLAITKNYTNDVHPDWENLILSLDNCSFDLHAVQTVSTDSQFSLVYLHRYPIVMKSPFYGGNVLRSNIWVENQRICEVVVLENGQPFHPGDAHIMSAFVSLVGQFIASSQVEHISTGLSEFFRTFLEKKALPPVDTHEVYHMLGITPRDDMTVLIIKSVSKSETPIHNVLYRQLETCLPHSCIFLYMDEIVCVSTLRGDDTYQKLVRHCAEIIPSDSFTWGISYNFQGIHHFYEYYLQAYSVAQHAISNALPYCTMYQAASLFISDELRRLNFNTLVHPDIHLLWRLDKETGSENFRTLFEFLLSGSNYTNAAKELHLHRNSLIYRISRIEELIGSSLNDPDNCRLLLYSCMLVGNLRVDIDRPKEAPAAPNT